MINQDSILNPNNSSTDFEKSGPFIRRSAHNKQNPYLQVNRDFTRDASLSLECRMIIIYLLSFHESWDISIPWIMKTQKISKDRMYRILDEAIEAGYLEREIYMEGNLKRTRYYLNEEPRLKKSFRCPEIQDPENQDAGDCLGCSREPNSVISPIPPLIYTNTKKEQYKKRSTSVASSSAEASDLYDHFLNEIRKRKPDFKEPSKAKWTADLDKILRIDKRSLSRAKELISWIMTDEFWSTVILSPQNLRKNFDKLEMKLEEWLKEKKKEPNKKLYYETRAKMPERFKLLKVDKIGVTDTRSGRDIAWSLPEKTFAQVLASMIGGRAYED